MDELPSHSHVVVLSKERPEGPSRQPSLLPAFEPLSSSPGGFLPRASKRKFEGLHDDRQYYPTPVPTSSTGILPSSPDSRSTRPNLHRNVSTLSERAPLGAVPSLDLPPNGEPVHMGRSSNSSDYQLSANRLISRVHVRAAYHAPTADRVHGEVFVECLGWNGAKVHYQGQAVELAKGESFVSDKPTAQIMVDVQETRVLLLWPRSTPRLDVASRSPSADETVKVDAFAADCFGSSPPMAHARLHSPISPLPTHLATSTFATTFVAGQSFELGDDTVHVYEDDETPDGDMPKPQTPVSLSRNSPELTKMSTPSKPSRETQSSSLSEPEELSEHDEENDPIVHSFGPFGDNLLSRFESFKSASPDRPRPTLKLSFNSPAQRAVAATRATRAIKESPVKNHVVNQLAFSRVHSVPLSTIYNNLPLDMRSSSSADTHDTSPLTAEELKVLLFKIPCVGEISREGKDAAGKQLENEFYYVPEMDDDEMRKSAVSVGKPPLRAVRKQHKQYYWKRPRH